MQQAKRNKVDISKLNPPGTFKKKRGQRDQGEKFDSKFYGRNYRNDVLYKNYEDLLFDELYNRQYNGSNPYSKRPSNIKRNNTNKNKFRSVDIKSNNSNSLKNEKQSKNTEDMDSNKYSNQENNNLNQKNENNLDNFNNNYEKNNNNNNNNYNNDNNYNNNNNNKNFNNNNNNINNNFNNAMNNEMNNGNENPYMENIQNIPNNNKMSQEENINNMNFEEDNMIDYRLQYTLNRLGLNSLMDIFLNNNMSFNDLLFLTKDDLDELNLELVKRNRLLVFIKEFSAVAKNYSLDEIKVFFAQNPKFKN